jgi:glycosyltransferase involved in cell wall biosynthesis
MRFSSTPEISVIMPTFNRARHLETAVQSVITQTVSNWELIIVDDGSSDNTFSILDPYICRFHNIRYLKHSNRKAALSRNAGIQASFGRYITFLDSDDHYLENHLETRMDIITELPELDLITGGFICDESIMVKDRNDLHKLINIRECTLGGTFFGKKELFTALKGFSELDYAEDADLWQRAAACFTVKKIEDPKTYVYRRAEDSTTLNY